MEEDQVRPPSSPDTGSASTQPSLASLLSDPAMLARIGTVMSALQGGNNSVSTEPTANTDSEKPQATDGLSSILSDPALLEKLPQIIATIKPLLDAGLLTKPTSASNEAAVAVSAPAHPPTHDRDNLLLSLKPFLSSGRRDAVDAILRIEKLGEILKQLK